MELIDELYEKYNGYEILQMISEAVKRNASDKLKEKYVDNIPFEELYTASELKLRQVLMRMGQLDAEIRSARVNNDKGIEPVSLLTVENLRKWIEEGKSYAEIARNTGNTADIVSSICRENKLQSIQSKKRIERDNRNESS